jgi:N-acetyl-gamma-glutamyl-phosphate reductase
MSRTRVGVVGGAGYAGGELVRLLLRHPAVELAWVQSKSQAGKRLDAVHTDLLGETELRFAEAVEAAEVWFLALGHGEAGKFLAAQPPPAGTTVIDLSNDFRLAPQGPAAGFVYGLPELNRAATATARHIANPGCFATAIQLALLPLAHAGLLGSDVHVSGITGSTGAGQALTETVHFSWRHANVGVYKLFAHQHLGEIGQSLRQLQPSFAGALHFVPYRGPFTRGILITAYLPYGGTLEQAQARYRDYYAGHPFTRVSPTAVDLKQVVNTNRCVLGLALHGGQLAVVSALDNLLKGAAGQAVQNMNIRLGLDETTGLQLKASAF